MIDVMFRSYKFARMKMAILFLSYPECFSDVATSPDDRFCNVLVKSESVYIFFLSFVIIDIFDIDV